jgi:hypothetical protein
MVHVVTVRRDEIKDLDDALDAASRAARHRYPPPEDCRFWWKPHDGYIEFIFKDHVAALSVVVYFHASPEESVGVLMTVRDRV